MLGNESFCLSLRILIQLILKGAYGNFLSIKYAPQLAKIMYKLELMRLILVCMKIPPLKD